MTGVVTFVFVASQAGAPMEARQVVSALAGSGLEGDRYAEGVGTYSTWPGTGRALTLVEEEALEAMEREQGVKLAPHETRRNLVTRGIRLNGLIGQRFRIGEVVLLGQRPADPCAHLERVTRPGVLRAMVKRGGLRADVETGGLISVGDEIVVFGESDPASG